MTTRFLERDLWPGLENTRQSARYWYQHEMWRSKGFMTWHRDAKLSSVPFHLATIPKPSSSSRARS